MFGYSNPLRSVRIDPPTWSYTNMYLDPADIPDFDPRFDIDCQVCKLVPDADTYYTRIEPSCPEHGYLVAWEQDYNNEPEAYSE